MKIKCVYNCGPNGVGESRFKVGEWYKFREGPYADRINFGWVEPDNCGVNWQLKFDVNNNHWCLNDEDIECYFITIDEYRNDRIDKLL